MESSLEFLTSLPVVRGITNPKYPEYEKFQNYKQNLIISHLEYNYLLTLIFR